MPRIESIIVSRRAVVTGAAIGAASPALASLPTPVVSRASSPDAPLFALIEAYREASDARRRAWGRVGDAIEAVRAAQGPAPAELYPAPPDRAYGFPAPHWADGIYREIEVDRIRDMLAKPMGPNARDRAEQIVSALDGWLLRSSFERGQRYAAEDAYDAALEHADDILQRIMDTEAMTRAGATAKAEAALAEIEATEDDGVIRETSDGIADPYAAGMAISALRDIKRLGAGSDITGTRAEPDRV